eukprot:sb/3463338/
MTRSLYLSFSHSGATFSLCLCFFTSSSLPSYAIIILTRRLLGAPRAVDMGENIWAYYMTRGNLKKTDETMAQEAVDAWYNEVKKYSFWFPGFSKKTGHFTQLVWKDTTKMGMAIAKDNDKAFICCNYIPQTFLAITQPFLGQIAETDFCCCQKRTTVQLETKMIVSGGLLTWKTDETMAQEAVDAWYNEVKKYSFWFPGFSKKTGHFTQLVWKDTTKMGMAIAKDNDKAFICCNYIPQVGFTNFYLPNSNLVRSSRQTRYDPVLIVRSVSALRSGREHQTYSYLGAKVLHGKVTHFLTPNLDVFGHNSAISWPNCFILGLLERGNRALSIHPKTQCPLSNEPKMKQFGQEMAELWPKTTRARTYMCQKVCDFTANRSDRVGGARQVTVSVTPIGAPITLTAQPRRAWDGLETFFRLDGFRQRWNMLSALRIKLGSGAARQICAKFGGPIFKDVQTAASPPTKQDFRVYHCRFCVMRAILEKCIHPTLRLRRSQTWYRRHLTLCGRPSRALARGYFVTKSQTCTKFLAILRKLSSHKVHTGPIASSLVIGNILSTNSHQISVWRHRPDLRIKWGLAPPYSRI